MDNGAIALPVAVTLHLGETALKTTLILSLEIATLRASIQGGDALDIKGNSDAHDFLGMSMRILPKTANTPAPFWQWRLDLSGGDARLALHPEAYAELAYTRIASKGRGLLFRVEKLAVTRDGINFDGKLQNDAPVQLAGVEQAFQFTNGRLVVERGALHTFTIEGAGQLPPALVGEATAKISLTLSQRDGAIVVQAANAELDLPGKPLVCKATCFTFTVDKLGLGFEDFGNGGTHFYFQITGSARFTPEGDAFSSGMLRYLPDLSITLEKAPLTTDARLLKDRISFQIAVFVILCGLPTVLTCQCPQELCRGIPQSMKANDLQNKVGHFGVFNWLKTPPAG